MVKLLDGIEDNNGRVMASGLLASLARCFRWHQVRDEDFTSPIVAGMARTSAKNWRAIVF